MRTDCTHTYDNTRLKSCIYVPVVADSENRKKRTNEVQFFNSLSLSRIQKICAYKSPCKGQQHRSHVNARMRLRSEQVSQQVYMLCMGISVGVQRTEEMYLLLFRKTALCTKLFIIIRNQVLRPLVFSL